MKTDMDLIIPKYSMMYNTEYHISGFATNPMVDKTGFYTVTINTSDLAYMPLAVITPTEW